MEAFTDEKDESGDASLVNASCGKLSRRCVPHWINDGDMELSLEDRWLASKTLRAWPVLKWDAEKVGFVNVTPFDFKTCTQYVVRENPEPHANPEPSPDEVATRISKRLKIFRRI